MNSVAIDSIATLHHHTRPYYRGLYTTDSLPTDLTTDDGTWFIIIHKLFDKTDKVGHWTAIFRNGSDISYYDTLADPPVQAIASFLNSMSASYKTNNQRHQPINSTACGEITLAYTEHRSRGHEHELVLRHFQSRSLKQNEAEAKLIVYGHMTSL